MADKKLIDVKEASDEALIKLWVEHYKKYYDDPDDKLLTKTELQEIYDEAYDRGLRNKLALLYNAMLMIHTAVRTDINNLSSVLLSTVTSYAEEYRLLKHLAYIYEHFKADTKELKKYREEVTEHLLKNYLFLTKETKEAYDKKESKENEYTMGEIAIDNTIVKAKKNLLTIRKIQALVPNIDIVSEKNKKQAYTLRQFIEVILADIVNDIDEVQYELGILEETIKEEDPEELKENEETDKKHREGDFYAFIDKNLGVNKFKEDSDRLKKLINKHIVNEQESKASKKLFDKLFKNFDEGVEDRVKNLTEEEREAFRQQLKEIKEKYPIEDVGLKEEDIKEVTDLVKNIASKKELI
jgi:hypothetical protein